jgi:hypothetical protein
MEWWEVVVAAVGLAVTGAIIVVPSVMVIRTWRAAGQKLAAVKAREVPSRDERKRQGQLYLIAGVVGFFVVNFVQGGLSAPSLVQAGAWVGLVGKVLCWVLIIVGIWGITRKPVAETRTRPPQ